MSLTYGQPTFESTDRLLQQVVLPSGLVNYKYLKDHPRLLQDATQELTAIRPSVNWNSNDELAYWINVYNIFTLELIVKNYPLKSIIDLDNGEPWDVKRIALNGKVYSLNQIENEIIRPKFKDPRIHFALNCAARSCPPLYHRAYDGKLLDKQLNERTVSFLNDPQFTQVSKEELVISKLFEWYKADFGDIINYINRYHKIKVNRNVHISYQAYDWGLNDQRNNR